MSRDYLRQDIDHWQDGLPFDNYGHALDADELYDAAGNATEDREQAKQAREVTNPYGLLGFAVGSGDDFYCFDFADLGNNRVAVHCTINSETGSFIDNVSYGIYTKRRAAYEIRGLVDAAITWTVENRIRHDKKGWDQDPLYVLRRYLNFLKVKPFKDYNEKELRFGRGRADRGFIELPFPCPKNKPKSGERRKPRKWQVEVRQWVGQAQDGVLFAGARRRGRGQWETDPAKLPAEVREYLTLAVQPGENRLVTLTSIESLEFFDTYEDGHVRRSNQVRFFCTVEEKV